MKASCATMVHMGPFRDFLMVARGGEAKQGGESSQVFVGSSLGLDGISEYI